VAQVRARDRELVAVLALVALDAGELDVREVVRLDRPLEARVDLLDLGEDARRLRLFRIDARGVGRCRPGGESGCR